jgi:hypothetical protein
VDQTGSRSRSITGFGISGVQTSGFLSMKLINRLIVNHKGG